MYSKFLSLALFFFSFLIKRIIYADHSKLVISFEPSYICIMIDETYSINVRLLVPEIIPPDVLIEFLYNGKLNDTQGYVNTLPNIIFTEKTGNDQSQVVLIHGQHQGHLVITGQSPQVNISSVYDFLLIDIARSTTLSILTQIVGWIYFLAWSISLYPQILLNFRRQSVVGLNFDYIALNLFGYTCYSIFNIYLYTSHDIQQQYYAQHPHGILPVLFNDVRNERLFHEHL